MADSVEQQPTREELEALRQRVLNVVGHELRTPTTTIRGLAELVEQAEPRQVREEIAPALVRNARRLEQLLDDLLAAVGVETALPVDAPQPVDLASAVAQAWQQVAGGHELRLEAAGEPVVLMSPTALQRVLGHVLDNAVKYGLSPVTVRVSTGGGVVTVAVDSPGELVHPAETHLVAEPFFRGYHAVTASPGLGLGLAVARALVEQAGGSLRFGERPEGGGVTHIILPCRPDQP